MKKLSAKAQASIDQVITKFQSGDLSPIAKVATIELNPTLPAAKWSFGNKVLAYIQTGGTLDCRGYRQWQSDGRQVKKGSAAVYIFRPQTIKKKDGEGEEKTICIGFSPIAVFSADDTEGEIPLPDYSPTKLPPLSGIAKRLGITTNYGPAAPDRNGDYSPREDHINLGTHQARTWFHELAHAVHHRIEGLANGQNAKDETIAEFTSCVLCSLYDIEDTSGKAWQYISNYADDPLKAIQKALGTVEKIVNFLMDETSLIIE